MYRNEQVSEFKERLVAVNRVSKTVKGGRNMRFSALVVVGDEKGRVGAGMGKAAEIPEAIRKAVEDAKKHLVTVPLDGTTIPHNVTGYFSTAKVVLLPASEGTGVIAGGAARAVLEMAGIDTNVYSGWAFGIGLERMAMRRFKIADLRLIFENDIRFLEQF